MIYKLNSAQVALLRGLLIEETRDAASRPGLRSIAAERVRECARMLAILDGYDAPSFPSGAYIPDIPAPLPNNAYARAEAEAALASIGNFIDDKPPEYKDA